MSTSAGLADGDKVRVKVIKNSGTPTVTVNSGIFYSVAETGIVDRDRVRSTIAASGYVYFNHLFEDINQIDFLKDFSVRFNVKMTERNGVIICKTMDEIFADVSNAVDWTSKRIPHAEQVRYAFNGLGRNNYLSYPKDGMAPDLSQDHGRGVFTIANEHLDEDATVYESIFNLSQMISNLNVFMVDLDRDYDVTLDGSYAFDIGKKLYYVRDRYTYEPAVVFTPGTPRTDYKVGYTIDPKQNLSMDWQFFVDRYYTNLIQRLQKAKVLTRSYRLTELDIHTFDQLKPIHDGGENFIVTRIRNFVSGRATEVELFKI